MPPKLIEDTHVQRILRNVKSGVRDGRDIADLMGDREARVALQLKTTRQIHHLRKRLAQAVAYLDGLARIIHEEVTERRPTASKGL
jgi:hypothetical protein